MKTTFLIKITVSIFFLSLFSYKFIQAQNVFPTEPNSIVHIDGGTFYMEKPNSNFDTWARGIINVDENNNVIAGMGVSGEGEDLIRYFIGHGRYPWSNNRLGMFILPNGNVGIGTLNPSSSLHLEVQGSDGILIEGDNSGNANLQITNGGGNHYIFDEVSDGNTFNLQSNNDLVFRTNGPNEKMRILKDGNVGIGAKVPNATLQIGDSDNSRNVNPEIELKRLSLAPVAHDASDWFFTARDNNPYANLDIGYGSNKALTLRHDGNVGIGTNNPQHKLEVCGIIRAKEVLVEEQWCDFVFEPEYCLTTLEEEADFIKLYGHLSNFESAKDMNGLINVNDIFKRQQIQLEENVLHLIELNEENEILQIQVNGLTDEVDQLTDKVNNLTANYEALAKELVAIKKHL